jgi:ribosomal protein S18 acetylase RimI-like enzyme
MISVRQADPSDQGVLMKCFVTLQEYERSLEANRAEAALVAKQYVESLLSRCARDEAQILVAEINSQVVGFIGVVPHHTSQNILERDQEMAYITDLIVLAEYRGHGIGRRLLREAEEYAAGLGARRMRIGVLAANSAAHALYRDAGYRDYEVILERRIGVVGQDAT